MQPNHLWLMTFPWSEETRALLPQSARVYKSLDGEDARAYLADADSPSGLPASVRLSRLIPSLDVPGADAGKDAPYQYVVATDVLPESETDFNRWYDIEHAPGLAAVPGTVRALRFVDPDGSPRYHACYDLWDREAFGSDSWLAVRATEWSSRVRPAFRNTHRKMYVRVP